MQNEVKFSIIVPVYNVPYENGVNLFARCMRSILAQTYPHLEVVIVDDGSTDDAPQQCDAYAQADPRVIVIHKDNKGAGAARNEGVRHSKGDYIFFVDADDEIDKRSCEVFAQVLMKYPNLDIIGSDAKLIKGKTIVFYKYTPTNEQVNGGEFLRLQYQNRTVYAATWKPIIKRDFLLQNNLFFREDIAVNEDCEWTPRLFLVAQSVVTSNFIHYIYYKRDGSRSRPSGSLLVYADMIKYCYELEERYANIEESELRSELMASLISLWLCAFRKGRFYGKKYDYLVRKDFLYGKAIHIKDRIWVFLFRISPYLYGFVAKYYYAFRGDID